MEEDNKYKVEEDKSIIYNSETDRDICMYFGEENKIFLLKVLNQYK